MRLWIIACFLVAAPTGAQTIKLSVGTSELLDATGGTVSSYFGKSTEAMSIAFINGQPIFGATAQLKTHVGTLLVGDEVSNSNGIATALRGVSFTKKRKRSRYAVFGGGVGMSHMTNFFSATVPTGLGAGASFDADLPHNLRIADAVVFTAKYQSAIQTAEWEGWRHKIKMQGQAGILLNQPFATGSVLALPEHWLTLGAFQNLLFVPSATKTDGATVGLQDNGWMVHYSQFMGHSGVVSTSGNDVGGGFTSSTFAMRADRFTASGSRELEFETDERWSRRFSTSQYVTRASNHWTVSYGGGVTSNRLSLAVTYQTEFLPLPGSRFPFQQVLSVSLGVQLSKLSAHYSTFVLPDGRVYNSGDGTSFFNGPMQESYAAPKKAAGKYVIRGQCHDTAGRPVEGCAIQIGSQLVFSTESGQFSIHVRSRSSVSLMVLPEQFILAGVWSVLNAPKTAKTGDEIKIVVKQN